MRETVKKRHIRICLVITMLLLVIPPVLRSQRYLPGLRGIQATSGIVDAARGYYVSAAWSRYNHKSGHWVLGGEYLSRQLTDNIPLAQFTGEGGYFMRVLSDRRKVFFLSVGLSALCGYETVNWGGRDLPDGGLIRNEDRFVYGGAATLEAEAYLTDRWVLLLHIRERGLWGGTTGRFHNQIGLGLKFIMD